MKQNQGQSHASDSKQRGPHDKVDHSDHHDVEFMLKEYECLREEIQARLLRISKLVMFLLTGLLVYATSIFVPLRFLAVDSGTQVTPSSPALLGEPLAPIVLIYFALIAILPFVSFAIEIMCTSEEDAITRTGIYIRDNIERKLGGTGYKGWEDWLDRQDKALRRRTSEMFATRSRYFIVILYCFTSATIAGLLISTAFNIHVFICAGTILALYLGCAGALFTYLRKARNTELSPNFYDVLIIDIDGCLANGEGNVSRRNVAAIQAVRRLGVMVILATGRGSYGIWRFTEQLSLNGLHVCANGACMAAWPDRRNDVLYPLPGAAIAPIVKELNSSQTLWAAFGETFIYCLNGKENEIRDTLLARGDISSNADVAIRPINDLDNWSWARSERISKIWCYVDVRESTKSGAILLIKIPDVRSTRTTNETIEFHSVHASKVKCVSEILGNHPRRMQKVLVLGDHDNDKEIMEWADHALAPSNASIAVRNLDNVDIFQVSNNEDFVAEALISYYEIKV